MEPLQHSPMTYGWLLTVVGMGGTLLSLWLLSLVMVALKRLLPPPKSDTGKEKP